MRGLLASVLILLAALTPTAEAGRFMIAGFANDLPGSELDDAVWISTSGLDSGSLVGYSLEDNTGRLVFDDDFEVEPYRVMIVAGNATAFEEATQALPDWTWGHDANGVTEARPGFALSQEADVIRLLGPTGEVEDVVVYGQDRPEPGWNGPAVPITGETFLRWWPRLETFDDNDSSDWLSARHRFLGQYAARPVPVELDRPRAGFAAPDASRSVLLELFERQPETVRVNMYEFEDLEVARALAAVAQRTPRGSVQVLLDEEPVGLEPAERDLRAHVVAILTQAGAEVRFLTHDRYAWNHAKYLVFDERLVLIQSENLKVSGLPPDGRSGNRGWGVILDSPPIADTLTRLFEFDFQVRPYGARGLGAHDAPDAPAPLLDYGTPEIGRFAPVTAAGLANATLLIAPEGPLGPADPILGVINGASSRIRVEQLELPPFWRERGGPLWPNPYLEALRSAAGRGVRVDILLDGSFDEGGELDNSATVERVREWSATMPIEARIWSGTEPGVLHNKGLVVDDRWVLVGSMNWNLNSVQQNREVDVLLEDPELASYFGRVFDWDWDQRPIGPIPGPTAAVFATVLSLALVWRGGGPGRKR